MAFLTTFMSLIGCNSKTDKKNSENGHGKIQMMNPNDLLMTLSTMENTIPGTNQDRKEILNLEILEDDWRQLEFISNEYLELIKYEIDSINLIIKNESVRTGDYIVGFKKLHVRASIPKPLKNGIELEALQKGFNSLEIGSLSFNRYGNVNDGIYLKVSSVDLYGLMHDSKITTFGFYGLSSWGNVNTFKTEIQTIMKQHNLVLVDWTARLIVDASEIDDYLKPAK